MLVIGRHEAKAQGLLKYFTGKPCLRGHVVDRWVNSGKCCLCAIEVTQEWRKSGCSTNPKTSVKKLPDKEYLLSIFEYKNGKLFWKERPLHHFKTARGWKIHNKRNAGKEAGYQHKVNNYIEVRVDGELHKAHRIIYKIFYEFDESLQIDHINRDPSDNRIENLRVVTNQQNSLNRHNSRGVNDSTK